MSIKEATEDVKKQAQELKKEVRGTVETVTEMIPRPLKRRKTVLLKKPLVELIRERRKSKKAL